jgi:hypothetical protein
MSDAVLTWCIVFFALTGLGCSDYAASPVGKPGKASNNYASSLSTNSIRDSELAGVSSIGVIQPLFRQEVLENPSRYGINQAEKQVISSAIITSLRQQVTLEVIDLREKALPEVNTLLARNQALNIGRKNLVQNILVTSIEDFQSRSGTQVGSNLSAALGFKLALLRVRDGSELWTATYSFRDNAITDNLLAINKRAESGTGPGWKNIKGLAQGAFTAAFRNLEERRLKTLLSK